MPLSRVDFALLSMATKVEGTMCVVRLGGNEKENMEIDACDVIVDKQRNLLIVIQIANQ